MLFRDHACASTLRHRIATYAVHHSARATICAVMCVCTMSAIPAALAQTVATALPQFPDTSFVTEKVIASGRAIFRGTGGCIICHGQNLQGVIGPTLLEHAWKDAKGGSMAEIFRVVVSGVPNTAMIARPNGISDQQVRQVAGYVWAVNHRHVQP